MPQGSKLHVPMYQYNSPFISIIYIYIHYIIYQEDGGTVFSPIFRLCVLEFFNAEDG